MRTMWPLLLPATICLAVLLFGCRHDPASEIDTAALAASVPGRTTQHDEAGLERRKGLLYLEGAPYSGILQTNYPNGQTAETGYLNGLKHGREKEYYEDGTQMTERYFDAGRKVAVHRGWWPSGQLQFQHSYVDGLLHGRQMDWYPEGNMRFDKTFKAGRKVADHRMWWANGQLRYHHHFVDGYYDGNYREWYPGGEPCLEFYYEKGEEVGNQKGWRENGKLYINYIVKDGRKYGLVNQRVCYDLSFGDGRFDARE